MDVAARTIALKENVAPKVVRAYLPYTDKVYVTFSEAVLAAGLTGVDDFVIQVGGSVVQYKHAVLAADVANTVVLELESPLTALKDVVLMVNHGQTVITDANGNPIELGRVAVTLGA